MTVVEIKIGFKLYMMVMGGRRQIRAGKYKCPWFHLKAKYCFQ